MVQMLHQPTTLALVATKIQETVEHVCIDVLQFILQLLCCFGPLFHATVSGIVNNGVF